MARVGVVSRFAERERDVESVLRASIEVTRRVERNPNPSGFTGFEIEVETAGLEHIVVLHELPFAFHSPQVGEREVVGDVHLAVGYRVRRRDLHGLMAVFQLRHVGLDASVGPNETVETERVAVVERVLDFPSIDCLRARDGLVLPRPDEPSLQALVAEQGGERVAQYRVRIIAGHLVGR